MIGHEFNTIASSTQEANDHRVYSVIKYKMSSDDVRNIKIIDMNLATTNTARFVRAFCAYDAICDLSSFVI